MPAGLLFSTPQQLSRQLQDLFAGFPAAAAGGEQQHQGGRSSGSSGSRVGEGPLAQLRAGVRGEYGLPRWHDSWRRTVLPVLEGRER